VVVGSMSGGLIIDFGNGTTVNTNAVQGEFGGVGNVPNNFSRTRLTFTPAVGNAVTFQRNVYIRPDTNQFAAVAPIFQLVVPSPSTTLSHTFPAGPQMLSLPIKAAVGQPGDGPLGQSQHAASGAVPAGSAGSAQPDKYKRYPSLPLYQPGYGIWGLFPSGQIANSIKGESTDNQQDISVAVEFGWNQIGPPYTTNLNITTDIFCSVSGQRCRLPAPGGHQWMDRRRGHRVLAHDRL